jgi:hypothetical protein
MARTDRSANKSHGPYCKKQITPTSSNAATKGTSTPSASSIKLCRRLSSRTKLCFHATTGLLSTKNFGTITDQPSPPSKLSSSMFCTTQGISFPVSRTSSCTSTRPGSPGCVVPSRWALKWVTSSGCAPTPKNRTCLATRPPACLPSRPTSPGTC